ncbi:CE1759 family FMN reductase [Lysinibacter cavernae]|uniref:FMN reductase n=1 Tax=Lysinibacter cavernae TaxID=1640652 RepID=A0A7X5R042_9MICO|nr:CE1759 family FMN reductase [Lysinibacter cavernae]NIH53178.1 FMN reductase [Lysinibacter cavernae]
MTSITIISAGVGTPSTTTMLAQQVEGQLRDQGGTAVTVRIVELRTLATDITNAIVTGFTSAPLQDALDAVASADALVAATPIYKGSYSGLFKSFIDIVDSDAAVGKPVLLTATGGTARHSLALDVEVRALFGYMRALVVPTVIFFAPEDWASDRAGALSDRVARGVSELLALTYGAGLSSRKPREAGRAQDIAVAGASADEQVIEFDTELMRLATGGSALSTPVQVSTGA